jgi:hypothetical protein
MEVAESLARGETSGLYGGASSVLSCAAHRRTAAGDSTSSSEMESGKITGRCIAESLSCDKLCLVDTNGRWVGFYSY